LLIVFQRKQDFNCAFLIPMLSGLDEYVSDRVIHVVPDILVPL